MKRKKDFFPEESKTQKYEVVQKTMDEIMHLSMLPYAEHVIMERALPRVEDGLKPVQRRILFTLHDLGITADKPYKKCARIVGDCLGKYHPHGDSSVYEAMVRMAQPYSMRGVLVDGHGNFGSIDGDSAAAMRYTEARMTSLAHEMLRDIEMDTVHFSYNFDDSLKEPDVLPSRFPNLLVNGASGIAVGLATNIPPHNLKEAINAVILVLDDPDTPLQNILNEMPCPDFPTGGCLINNNEIQNAYETGRGKLTLRSRISIEPGHAGRQMIVINEIPYGISKAGMLEKIQKLCDEKKSLLNGIYDIRDESDRNGLRAVIEIKKDIDVNQVLSILYKYSDIQTTFGVNIVVIADGRPVQMGLKSVIDYYIQHQETVIKRRSIYELIQAKSKEHILLGLMIAVQNIEKVIKLIRNSKNPKEAKENLISTFNLDDPQAQAILDLRLQRLTRLELDLLQKEYNDIRKRISYLELLLNSAKKIREVIKKELEEIRDKYGDARKTSLIDDDSGILPSAVIKPSAEKTVLIYYTDGQIRRMNPKLADKIIHSNEADSKIQEIIYTITDETAYFFTNLGNCYSIDLEKITESVRLKERGTQLSGLINGFNDNEKCVGIICAKDPFSVKDNDLVFVTKKGLIRRTAMNEFILRRSHFTGIKLKKDDELAGFVKVLQNDKGDLLMISKSGFSIRIPLSTIPTMGRITAGSKGIAIDPNDSISFFMKPSVGTVLFVITERGYGKRIISDDIDRSERGTKGQRIFPLPKSGEFGTELSGVLVSNGNEAIQITQRRGRQTIIQMDNIRVERKSSKGQMLVSVLMDDIVMFVEKK